MADEYNFTGYKLPVNPAWDQGTAAQGFVTPKQDRIPQIQSIPPKRLLPIIFIPGIMGSNLRMSNARQSALRSKNNIAWRPDTLGVTAPQYNDTPAERQRRLDPAATELDIYDPIANPTGDPKESAEARSDEVSITFGYGGYEKLDGPLLQSDGAGTPNRKTKNEKARERGWGEIYFSSYYGILASLRIPRQTGHPFRGKLDTWSNANWTLIPRQTGHPVQRKLDTGSTPNWTV